MSNDLDEFMTIANGSDSEEGSAFPLRPLDPEEKPRREGKKKVDKTGRLKQYADVGGAYVPTTDTIRTLPPDCYTLSLTMEGQAVFVQQNLVTDDLMRLPDSKSEQVLDEVERFWTLKDKFKQYGFAHKRGFLLWGPPGSGKTSTLAMITQDMIKKEGIVLLAENPVVLGKALAQMRTIERERPLVVVWEDIDTIIQMYGESTVLSILDGEAQVENVVFLATTNYPERLDGRIVNRPSRFDKIVKIDTPNAEARAMFLNAKIKETTKDGYDLVKETEGLSIAHLKELIVSVYCQGTTVKETLERLKKMGRKPVSDRDEPLMGMRG